MKFKIIKSWYVEISIEGYCILYNGNPNHIENVNFRYKEFNHWVINNHTIIKPCVDYGKKSSSKDHKVYIK